MAGNLLPVTLPKFLFSVCWSFFIMRIFLPLLLAAGLWAQPKPLQIDRLESTIQKYLESDKSDPPVKGQIEFIGSSIFNATTTDGAAACL